MTPQELFSVLLLKKEQEGRQLLRTQLLRLHERAVATLVDLLKREADRQWNSDPELSLTLSGYIITIGELTHKRTYRALGLMARGDALRRLECEQEALPFFDAAGEEFLAAGDEVGWARTRIGRVSACLTLNRPTEALQDAAKAHDIFIKHQKFLRAGQIDVNAAVINYELGQYEQALRLFDRAIETYILQGEGVDLYIARARGNKALVLAALGKFREAVALHEQARTTFAAYSQQEVSVAREDLNIAQIYAAQGHYSQALRLFNQSRVIFLQHNLEPQAAEVAQHICLCLIHLNRTREAYELAEETVAFFRKTQSHHHNLAHSLMYQAEAGMREGKLSEAAAMLQEARDILVESNFMGLAAIVRLRQAELYFTEGKRTESLHEAQHAADTFADQGAFPQLARASLLQARIAETSHDLETANDLCLQALDIARGQDLLDLQYQCNYLLGQIAEHHDDLEAAALYYQQAIQGIDEVQSRLVVDERTSFLEDKDSIYQRAVTLALKRGQKQQALVYVEKAKSRVLGDYLRNNIDIRLRGGDKVSENLLEDLTKLREEQAWFSSMIYERGRNSDLTDTAFMRVHSMSPVQARQEMQAREKQIEQLLEQMQLRLVGDVLLPPRASWTDTMVTSLWSQLEPGTVVVEYYIAGQDLYIFQMSRKGIDVHHLSAALPQLDRLLSLWRINLELAVQAASAVDRVRAFAGLQENSQGLLQRLYNLLLDPVARLLERCEHLIIVPYGMLHYVPFHCFFDGSQFLVEKLNISYLPALSLLDICTRRGQQALAQRVPLNRSLVLGFSDGGRLPFTVSEARAVAAQLGTHPILNEHATTSILEKFGGHSPIVHIAAHGLFRLDAPNFSHIKLADRQLSTIEAFNLDLSSASLVTLSACETGRAVVGGVDEVIGLGRGFLYAGAASLLPTFWKVDDASSAELMEMFYQALLGEYGKAAALAGAQRAFLARARTSQQSYRTHPYFWAAFHLIGDYGPLL